MGSNEKNKTQPRVVNFNESGFFNKTISPYSDIRFVLPDDTRRYLGPQLGNLILISAGEATKLSKYFKKGSFALRFLSAANATMDIVARVNTA